MGVGLKVNSLKRVKWPLGHAMVMSSILVLLSIIQEHTNILYIKATFSRNLFCAFTKLVRQKKGRLIPAEGEGGRQVIRVNTYYSPYPSIRYRYLSLELYFIPPSKTNQGQTLP